MLPTAREIFAGPLEFEFENMRVRVVRFSCMTDRHPWHIPMHAHENYEFHYIFQGKGSVRLGKERFDVSANDIYLCPCFVGHQQDADESDPMYEYCIECAIQFVQPEKELNWETDALANMANRIMYTRSVDRDGKLLNILRELDDLCGQYAVRPLEGERTYIKLLMMCAILRFMIVQSEAKRTMPQCERLDTISQRAVAIKNYLEGNLQSKITIHDCAKVFYLSERQIDRLMKREYGKSFFQYLTNLRVGVAVKLLQQTDLTMEEIAEQAGFSGYRQMMRAFERCGALRPSDFRRNRKNTQLEEKR